MKKEEKQQKLREFYDKKFSNIDLDENLSSPHLISLNNKNINTDIMVIGQETNSWDGSIKDFYKRGLDAQMKIYDEFMNIHYQNKNNLFFKYIKDIVNDISITPVWTNVFKFDLGDGTSVKNISKASSGTYEKVLKFHEDILSKEIEIIQPKIIIFFTGHTYDKLFFDPIVKKDGDYKKLYLKIDELNGIDEWKCCKMNLNYFEGFEHFKGLAFRTYHPIYLNRNLKTFGKNIVDYLKQEFKEKI